MTKIKYILVMVFTIVGSMNLSANEIVKKNLVWLDEAKDAMSYDVAQAYCSSKKARLPTANEMIETGEIADLSQIAYFGYWVEDMNFTYPQVGRSTENGFSLHDTSGFIHGGVYVRCVEIDKINKLLNTTKTVGSNVFRINYTYDSEGNLVSKTWDYDYGIDEVIEYTIEYTYDENNNMLTSIYKNYDTILRSTSFTYDTQNNLLTFSSDFNGNGSEDSSEVYTYDNNSNRLSESWNADNAHFTQKKNTFTYDTSGNRISREYRDENDIVIGQELYTYDEQNNRLHHQQTMTMMGILTTQKLLFTPMIQMKIF